MDELYLKDKEIWKDIPGFEGKYQASTFGTDRAPNESFPPNSAGGPLLM